MATLGGYTYNNDARLDGLESNDIQLIRSIIVVDGSGINNLDGTDAAVYVIDTRTNSRSVRVNVEDNESLSFVQLGNNPIDFRVGTGTIEGETNVGFNSDRASGQVCRIGSEHFLVDIDLSDFDAAAISAAQAGYTSSSPPPLAPTVNPLVTQDTTPTITGTMTSGHSLSVTLAGVTYVTGDGNLIDNNNNTWTLNVPVQLSVKTHNISAVITDIITGLTTGDNTSGELIIQAPASTVTKRGLMPVETLSADYVSSSGPTFNGYNTIGNFEFRTAQNDLVATVQVQLTNVSAIHAQGTTLFSGVDGISTVLPAPNGVFQRPNRLYSLQSGSGQGVGGSTSFMHEFDMRVVHTDNFGAVSHNGYQPDASTRYTISDWDNYTELSSLSRPWDSITFATSPQETSTGVFHSLAGYNAYPIWTGQDINTDFAFHVRIGLNDTHTLSATMQYRRPVAVEVVNDGSDSIVSATTSSGTVAPANYGDIEIV